MTILQLNNLIRNNTPPSLLIMYGEEHTIMREYIKQYERILCKPVMVVDSVAEAVSLANRKKLFGEKGGTSLLVHEDSDFLGNENSWKKVISLFKDNKDFSLIVTYSKIDKRYKFYKKFPEEYMCEFNKVSEATMLKYISKELQGIDELSAHLLYDACEQDLGIMRLEVDKIKHYMQSEDVDIKRAIADLRKSGLLNQSLRDITFEFAEKILKRLPLEAYDLSLYAKSIGEPELLTLSTLYTSARNVLMIQGSPYSRNLSKDTGINAWIIKNTKHLLNYYSVSELSNMLNLITDIERGIKTGTFPPGLAVDYILCSIL